jgi:hypothetical protein
MRKIKQMKATELIMVGTKWSALFPGIRKVEKRYHTRQNSEVSGFPFSPFECGYTLSTQKPPLKIKQKQINNLRWNSSDFFLFW